MQFASVEEVQPTTVDISGGYGLEESFSLVDGDTLYIVSQACDGMVVPSAAILAMCWMIYHKKEPIPGGVRRAAFWTGLPCLLVQFLTLLVYLWMLGLELTELE